VVVSIRLLYFNSTLVRLKGGRAEAFGVLEEFQFHIGTIKSLKSILKRTLHSYFNSTLVRLKEKIPVRHQPRYLHFNSTLVRLKVRAERQPLYLRVFQFHIGTIKSLLLVNFRIIKSLFQFHIGTIKSEHRTSHCRSHRISIPHWYD